MSIYDDALTTKEKHALRQHAGESLQDEIELLQVMIKRGLDDQLLDVETLCKALDALTRATLARKKLATGSGDELRLAFLAALNTLDGQDNGPLQPALPLELPAPGRPPRRAGKTTRE